MQIVLFSYFSLDFCSLSFKFWSKFATACLFCLCMSFISPGNLPSYLRCNPGNWRDRPASFRWDMFIRQVLNERSYQIKSWRLFDVWTSYFGIKGQYDPKLYLKINVGLCDLYFMVQWLCLISRLFDAWVSYFQIMRLWSKLWPESKYKSTWPIFHGLVILLKIFQDYLMDEHHSWYNGSVWHIIWPYQIYVGQWPIFYGPAILLHIL